MTQTAPAKAIKLTLAQWTVLRHARDGHVYRSESGHDLYTCYDSALYSAQGNKHKKVTAIVSRLCALGLLQIDERNLMQRVWNVTEQGAKVLAQLAQKELP